MQGHIALLDCALHIKEQEHRISLPDETVIVDEKGKRSTRSILPVFADITLHSTQDIPISYKDLKGRMRGKIRLQNYPKSGLFATGTLQLVQGTYALQGEALTLNHSTLSFNHSLITNPELNIRATKIVYQDSEFASLAREKITVGLRITGTAQSPKIVLFSDPATWSDPDILSLIVIGQPASMASGAQLQLLALAAKHLSAKSGAGKSWALKKQIQQFLGLSEFSLQSTLDSDAETGKPTQSTAFVLGKRLGPRLYVSYSVGIQDAINTLRLKYILAKHWFIQTQSNDLGSGVDLFYWMTH